jgi:hypothetical protein
MSVALVRALALTTWAFFMLAIAWSVFVPHGRVCTQWSVERTANGQLQTCTSWDAR